jgi:uncharacterized membrane protein
MAHTFEAKDINENKVVAALSYLGILCLVPLLAKKDSKYCQAHGKQGLALFLFEIILWFINIIPFLGQLLWLVFGLTCIVVSIIAIIKTLQGEYWEIPVIGEYSKRINL